MIYEFRWRFFITSKCPLTSDLHELVDSSFVVGEFRELSGVGSLAQLFATTMGHQTRPKTNNFSFLWSGRHQPLDFLDGFLAGYLDLAGRLQLSLSSTTHEELLLMVIGVSTSLSSALLVHKDLWEHAVRQVGISILKR